MDSAEFHAEVYRVVRLIPFGKATSYGHVAKLIGMPRHSRHVGQALKFLPEGTDVPWQRVVSSSGKISSRGPGTEGAQRQREALEEEGVNVRVTRDGDFAVNWGECGWFPERVTLDRTQAVRLGDGNDNLDENGENLGRGGDGDGAGDEGDELNENEDSASVGAGARSEGGREGTRRVGESNSNRALAETGNGGQA